MFPHCLPEVQGARSFAGDRLPIARLFARFLWFRLVQRAWFFTEFSRLSRAGEFPFGRRRVCKQRWRKRSYRKHALNPNRRCTFSASFNCGFCTVNGNTHQHHGSAIRDTQLVYGKRIFGDAERNLGSRVGNSSGETVQHDDLHDYRKRRQQSASAAKRHGECLWCDRGTQLERRPERQRTIPE